MVYMLENRFKDKGKDIERKTKKAAKTRMTAKIAAVLLPIILKLVVVLVIVSLVATLIGGFVKIIRGEVFQWAATSTDKLQELEVVNTEQRCLNLSDEIVDELILTLMDNGLNVAKLKMLGEDEDKIEQMTDEEITTGMRKYIREYYAAELITQYPDMSDKPGDSADNRNLGEFIIDTILGGTEQERQVRKYKYQGCITLIKPDENGNVTLDENEKVTNTYLKYIAEEEFQALCNANDATVENYFTVSGNNIKVAGKTITDGIVSYYTTSLNFKAIASAYTMPMEFLLMMNLYSENPEFTYALAKMVKDSQIALAVQYNYAMHEEIVNTEAQNWIEETTHTIEKQGENGEVIQEQITIPAHWSEVYTTSTKTTIESYTPAVQLVLADTWIVKKQVEYTKKVVGPDTQVDTEEFYYPEDSRGTITTTITTESHNYVESGSIEEEKTKLVLGLLRNAEGIYNEDNLLEFEPEKRSQMKYVRYKIPNTIVERSPSANVVTGAKMMIDDLEKNESTQNQAEIMKYVMYVYTGIDQYGGATEFDQLKDLFVTKTFLSNSGSSSTLKEFIHYFEGAPEENGMYKVYADSGGILTVGYGVTITNYGDALRAAGATDLSEGALVEKSIVDAVEDSIIAQRKADVESRTAGLNLTPYQIQALVSRTFNCGLAGGLRGFETAYTQYWKESDNQLGVTENSAMYQHGLYTSCMSKPIKDAAGNTLSGLEKRRKAEWLLFKTGYYINSGTFWTSNSEFLDNFLQAAEETHKHMEANKYIYYSDPGGGALPNNIANAWTNKHTCCATYVNWALYEAGYKAEGDLPSNPHSSPELYNFFKNKFEHITSYNQLQPGDIVFVNGSGSPYSHVQIYAGNGQWYNAGSTEAIQRPNPYSQDDWAMQHFTVALRPTTPQ